MQYSYNYSCIGHNSMVSMCRFPDFCTSPAAPLTREIFESLSLSRWQQSSNTSVVHHLSIESMFGKNYNLIDTNRTNRILGVIGFGPTTYHIGSHSLHSSYRTLQYSLCQLPTDHSIDPPNNPKQVGVPKWDSIPMLFHL